MIETLLFALGLNMAMFAIAFRYKTDKLTDISYAVTFFGIALFGVFTHDMTPAKWVVFGLVTLWAVRLGSFLLYRVSKVGKDSRFDEMRNSFWKFGRFWFLQGLTAWVVMLPASYLLATTKFADIKSLVVVGALISIAGILIEGTADIQKFRFTQNPKNKGKWIDEGLWHYSRHPNYFGEMMMWYGVYITSLRFLADNQVFFALASPIFITVLLVAGSGIPILEKSADKRWGHDKKYQAYKKSTSILIPLPKRKI